MKLTDYDRDVLAVHKMEQRSNVYLRLNTFGVWEIDAVFLQAGETDGLDEADDQGCSCDDFLGDEHKRAHEIARSTELPDPVTLLRMIIAAMFPYDAPPDLTDRTSIEAWLDDPDRKGPIIL